ncbi:MAG: C45 family autoproteolytic acyltransferase/hydrolase [Myxococcota bacterium]
MFNLLKIFRLNDLNELEFKKPDYANSKIKIEGSRRTLGPAYIEKHGNIFVGSFEGSDYEMGYQHGRLLKDEIRQGVIPYLYNFARLLMNKVSGMKAINDIIRMLAQKFFYERIIRAIPEKILDSYIGVADGAGFDRNQLYVVVGFADMLQVASGILNRRYKVVSLPPVHFCTSIVAWGNASRDGKLIHGRNLDYEAYNVWERFPLIARMKPDGGIPYTYFSSAGVHSGGLTGINDYGIAFNVHTKFTSQVGFSGPPMQVIGDYLLRHSRTLEDAEGIIKGMKYNCGWTFVISQDSKPFAKAFEVDSKDVLDVKIEKDYLVTTNCYKNQRLRKREISINRTMDINFVSRLRRISALAEEYYSKIDADAVVNMLSDNFSPYDGKEMYDRNTIAQLSTIQSVVMNVSDRVYYLADGRSPVCYGRYFAFDSELKPLLRNKRHLYLERRESLNNEKLRALRLYINAAYLHNVDEEREITAYLKESITRDKESDFYLMVYAFYLLKERRYKEANEVLNKAILIVNERPEYLYRLMLYKLWLGRTYDLSGFRTQAKVIYKEIVKTDNLDVRLIEAACRGIRRRFDDTQLKKVMLNCFTAEFIKL